MKLTPDVLPLLYGKRLYRLRAAGPATPDDSAVPDEEGAQAVPEDPWVRGSRAQVALVYGTEAALPPGAELLEKIVASMGLALAAQDRLQTATPPDATTLAQVQGPLVFFGSELAVHAGSRRQYVLPSLAHLVADTAQKRLAWETIKTFKDTL